MRERRPQRGIHQSIIRTSWLNEKFWWNKYREKYIGMLSADRVLKNDDPMKHIKNMYDGNSVQKN